MKSSNSTEEQLRSWRLRQPSKRIEQALFGKPEPRPAKTTELIHWQRGWAAGMATVAIVLFTALNLVQMEVRPSSTTLIASAAISNASYAASFAEVQHNCLSAPIFGWTNDEELHSSMPSLDLLNTNSLR